MRPWSRLALVAAALLPAAPLHAAEPFAPGSWSAQFSVQPNFTLGSFQGSTLSLKRHFGGGRALRLGLSVSVTDREDGFDQSARDTTVLFSTTSETDANNWSIGVSGHYLWYSNAAAPVHVYGGGGPFASVSSGTSDVVEETIPGPGGGPTSVRTSHEDSNGWGAGLAIALGVEWQVASRIGVFAEYQSSVGYFSSETTRNSVQTFPGTPSRTTTFDADSHRIQFSGSGGQLGVSAYF